MFLAIFGSGLRQTLAAGNFGGRLYSVYVSGDYCDERDGGGIFLYCFDGLG